MRVALERTVMSPETYIEVCVSAGLSVPNIEAVQRGLPRSLYSVCAVDKLGRTLGFARVVGDGGVFFEIVDVAVRKECQGNGIGRTLMLDVLAWLEREAHSDGAQLHIRHVPGGRFSKGVLVGLRQGDKLEVELGILTWGNVCALIVSLSPMMPLSRRM